LETFGQLINLRGYYLKKLGRYYDAKTSFEDVLQLQMTNAPASKPVIYALKEIAQINLRMLDYEGMESVLRLAERQDTAEFYTFSILNSYLVATYYQGKIRQAIAIFKNSKISASMPAKKIRSIIPLWS
jgi:tetratricopeptide (TPR) repeat protein